MSRCRSVAAAMTALLFGPEALAEAPALEEVIVTATKRAESLQDVPVTVNAVTADTLQAAGIIDLADLSQLVPALTTTTILWPVLATGL